MALNDYNAQSSRSSAYARTTGITATASTVTLPTVDASAEATGPSRVLVSAPSGNTDVVRVETNGTAVAASKPINPGDQNIEIRTHLKTISVKSDTGTQILDITAYYA